MNIIRLIALSGLLLGLCACASNPPGARSPEAMGGSERIESAQVQVGYGQSGTPDYRQIISDPGPF